MSFKDHPIIVKKYISLPKGLNFFNEIFNHAVIRNFKLCQFRKMVKTHTTIWRQELMNCLSVFDYFVGLTLEGLNILDSKKLLGTNQILPKFMLQLIFCVSLSLHGKCPQSEFFWSLFSRIRTKYGEILPNSPYSVQMRENTDQKNSEYGHFSRSVFLTSYDAF